MKRTLKRLLSRVNSMGYRQSFAWEALDKRLEPFIGKRGGFFIEAGANDGIAQSNTLYFEKYFGWRGILVEPIPQLAAACRQNRPDCIVEEVALASVPSEEGISLTVAGLMTTAAEAFSDNDKGYSAEKHLERAATIYQTSVSDFQQIQVSTKTLSQICDEHPMPCIDLLSLDVEGFEGQVLEGLNLEKHRPRYILVEERNGVSYHAQLAPYYRKEAVLCCEEHYQDTLYRCVL